MRRRRKRYRKLSKAEFQVVDTYVRQCVAENPESSLAVMLRALKKNWTGEQKLTYGHVLAARRRAVGYKPGPKKPPLTVTDSTGQQTWQWSSSKDTGATLGSIHVSYTAPESVFDQGIRLIKAGLLLVEGGKSA
jgi:hypothetical protein